MDSVLQVLLSWQFALFSVAVGAITGVLRALIEYLLTLAKVVVKESKLWNDVGLPSIPIILGATAAVFITGYPYPEGLSTTGARFIFGLVAGFLSSFLYRVIKAVLNQKITSLLGGSKEEDSK